MSYYRVGDYYLAGDPGLLSSIGGFIKTAARGALGLVTGGPVGAAAAVLPGVTGSRAAPSGIALPTFTPRITPTQAVTLGAGVGGAAAGFMNARNGAAVGGAAGMAPKGYRLNKTGYFLKSGQYIAPGTKWVRVRRRNFANGRALNRAIGRTAGFNRLVKRSRKNLRALAKI